MIENPRERGELCTVVTVADWPHVDWGVEMNMGVTRAVVATLFSVLVFSEGAAATPTPEEPAPAPPRAPGAIGLPSPSPAGSAVRQAAIDAYTRRFNISESEANRRLDLQAKVGDLKGALIRRLGRGFSQTYFDNDAGRFVVSISPRGDDEQAREAMTDLGLTGSQVERTELDHQQLAELVDVLSERLAKVVRAGHATVALVRSGVKITAAAGATADEQDQIDDAAATHGVVVNRSSKDDLSQPPNSCNGSYVDNGIPGRYCDLLRGGSRYWNAGCTLGWWAGPNNGTDPNYFLTAGHCVTPGGAVWRTCTAAHDLCGWNDVDGNEIGQRYDSDGGDNGLLHITRTTRWREAGYTDWRDGTRQPITYYQYYPPIDTLICHGGATTGYSCGFVNSNDATVTNGASPLPCSLCWPQTELKHMIVTRWNCVQGGDSGGPVFTADMRGAVGMTSAGTCNQISHTEPIWRAIQTYGVWPYGG